MDFSHSYMTLSDHEEGVIVEEIKKLEKPESDKVFEVINSYVEIGRVEGREEVQGKVALKMLKLGFPVDQVAEQSESPMEHVIWLQKK